MKPLRTIALLGRTTGLAVLSDALIGNPLINLMHVFTHGQKTTAEGGGPRLECAEFEQLCSKHNIPSTVIDLPEARYVENFFPDEVIDLLVVLSWKYILSDSALALPRLGGINLHRGALPKYAGLEPVRRAIEARETHIAITAHWMIGEVDMGPEISRIWIRVKPSLQGEPAEVHAEAIKKQITPLYVPLAKIAIQSVAISINDDKKLL
jgi:methionyl-tRNA formyltransferase